MSVRILILLLLPGFLAAQTASAPFNGNFDGTTADAEWTISTYGTATTANTMRWWTTGEIPGIQVTADSSTGGGRAIAPWAVGSGAFYVKGDIYPTNAWLKPNTIGAVLALTTAQPGSMSGTDTSIAMGVMNQGVHASMRTGEITNFGGSVLTDLYNYTRAANTLTAGTYYAPFTGNAALNASRSAVQQAAAFTDSTEDLKITLSAALGSGASAVFTLQVNGVDTVTTCTIAGTSQTGCTFHLTASSDSGVFNTGDLLNWKIVTTGTVSGTRDITLSMGDVGHSNGGYKEVALWPHANLYASTPYCKWSFEAFRDTSNNLTFNIYTEQFKNGLVPYYSQTLTIPVGHQADNFQYISLMTMNGTSSASNLVGAKIANLYGYAGITGTPFTVTKATPSGGATTYATGNQITITGTGFDSSSTYTLKLGTAAEATTATATYASATTLTATLPSLTTDLIYQAHVTRNGIDAEIPGGIYYNAGKVTNIFPFEVLPTPANTADATVTFTGFGFDGTTAVTFAGVSGTVSAITPTQCTVVVPSGTQGAPRIIVTVASGATTLYDSNTSSTFPVKVRYPNQTAFTAKLNFGYSGHPYIQYNAGGLAAIQAKWSNPSYADYVTAFNTNMLTDGTGGGTGINGGPTWLEWGFHYILSGTSGDYTTYTSLLASDPVGVNLAPGRLNNIATTRPRDQFPSNVGEEFFPVAQFYDSFFAQMTPTERAAYQDYLLNGLAVANYYGSSTQTAGGGTEANSFGGGNVWTNRIAKSQTAAAYEAMALINSLQSFRGYLSTAPVVSATGLTQLTKAATQLVSYGNTCWLSDGGYVEGSQYVAYGTSSFAAVIHAMQYMTAQGILANDQGIGGSNYNANYANWIATQWDGTMLAIYNDTQPEIGAQALLIDIGSRYSSPHLLWIADQMEHQIAANSGIGASLHTHVANGVAYGSPWEIMWRAPGSFATAAFTPWSTVTVNSAVQQAALRSDSTFTTPFFIGVKGVGTFESNGQAHKQTGDRMSFVCQFMGDEFCIDLGYYRPNAAQHSVLTVDGVVQTTSNSTAVTTVDASPLNTSGWRSLAMDGAAVYPSATVSRMRRTYGMHVNGSKAIAFILDDALNNSNAGAIVSYFQSGKAVSSASSSGFTMTGTGSGTPNTMAVVYDGPSRTVANTVNNLTSNSVCSGTIGSPSWILCALAGGNYFAGTLPDVWSSGTLYGFDQGTTYLGQVYLSKIVGNIGNTPTDASKWTNLGATSVFYNTVTNSYTADPANPMVTFLEPNSGSGALTATVNRAVSGTIVVTISDGATATFTQPGGAGSKWLLSSTTDATAAPPASLMNGLRISGFKF